MINIKSIINTFSAEEQSRFISFLNQKNKRTDAKNIELFKIIRDGESNTETICTKLYGKVNRNAYHALRNRLLHSLIDYTANKNLEDENSIEMQVIKYILASRTFLIQKKHNIAYKILDKAENLAEEQLFYPILNEIYHTKIQYASEYPKANLESLVLKQQANRKKHQLEDELNIVYAKLKSALNTINYTTESIDFENILNKSLKNTGIILDDTLSFKSLYQILQIANISAFVTTKYYKIEDFALRSYSILKQKKESDKQLFYQIEIVYIIGNTLFRNRKFKASLEFMKEMEQLMQLKRKQYFKSFILKKTLVEALNLNYTNNADEAISKIEAIRNNKHSDVAAILDLHLCLIMFYFQQGQVKNAKSILAKFYHTDKWYTEKAGINWVVKKNLLDILLYVETQDEDLFFSRLNSFKKRYSKYLHEKPNDKTLVFLKFVEQYFKNPEVIHKAEFKTQFANTFSSRNIAHEDIFDLSFYAWLKCKIENSSVYETTLEIIKK